MIHAQYMEEYKIKQTIQLIINCIVISLILIISNLIRLQGHTI